MYAVAPHRLLCVLRVSGSQLFVCLCPVHHMGLGLSCVQHHGVCAVWCVRGVWVLWCVLCRVCVCVCCCVIVIVFVSIWVCARVFVCVWPSSS